MFPLLHYKLLSSFITVISCCILFCVSVKASFRLDRCIRHDRKSDSVKYRFSGLAFHFLCKLVPCSVRIDHTKKLPTFFWNRKVHYCPMYNLVFHLFKIHFNIILPSTCRFSVLFLSFRFLHQNTVFIYLLSHTNHMLCPSCPRGLFRLCNT